MPVLIYPFYFLETMGANVYLAGDKVVERGIIRQREGRNGLVWSGLVLSYDGNAFPMEQLLLLLCSFWVRDSDAGQDCLWRFYIMRYVMPRLLCLCIDAVC